MNNSAAEFWKFLMQMDSFDKALKEVLKLYEDSSELVKKIWKNLLNPFLKPDCSKAYKVIQKS
ncbi:MAG: hypothetical protein HC773_25390 [Scytonema sp. CRU_2_7]|nr:hypothetical protein [Scytonema sp. CRU_2_7]